jgi:hypothetical protein
MASLVETGAKKLTQLYTKVVAEGSSGTTPVPGSMEAALTSFPASLLPTLSPVVKFLRTLPLPQTHPSHPAAAAIQKTLSDALKGYADMRGSWAVKCLDGQGKRLVVRANEVDPRTTGREFGEWVELILGTAEVCFLGPLGFRELKNCDRKNTSCCWNSLHSLLLPRSLPHSEPSLDLCFVYSTRSLPSS